MNQFSLAGAWAKGIGFFSGNAANQAIILIGLGIGLPMLLQILAMGGVVGMMNPAMMGSGGMGGFAAGGALAVIAILAGYILQMSSYFASWRLGFGEDETLGGAIVFGVVGGLMLLGAFIAVGLVGVVLTMAAQLVGALLMVLLLVPIFAIFYTMLAAVFSFIIFLSLLIMVAFGASMAGMNMAPELVGGGAAVLIGLVLVVLIFWLTARLSCVTSVMADQQTFNLFSAIAESWRLTSASQWRILGYLALLSAVLSVAFLVVSMIIGAGMLAGMRGGGMPEMGVGVVVAGLIIGIPLAYLTVLVPAGIYRALGPQPVAASIFA